MRHSNAFKALVDFLIRVPGIDKRAIGTGFFDEEGWWVKFSIDINHPLAWQVVQEFGFVLNHVSLSERLPTVFMPVSPPPYLNGGPEDHLSWVIECTDSSFKPDNAAEWLEGRLPRPVEDEPEWIHDE
jgi:hypothetical protein